MWAKMMIIHMRNNRAQCCTCGGIRSFCVRKLKAALVCLLHPPSHGLPGTGPYPGYSTPSTCTFKKSRKAFTARQIDRKLDGWMSDAIFTIDKLEVGHEMRTHPHVVHVDSHLSVSVCVCVPATGCLCNCLCPCPCLCSPQPLFLPLSVSLSFSLVAVFVGREKSDTAEGAEAASPCPWILSGGRRILGAFAYIDRARGRDPLRCHAGTPDSSMPLPCTRRRLGTWIPLRRPAFINPRFFRK